MKRYCYAIVQSDGISHDLWPDWESYEALDSFNDEENEEEDEAYEGDAWRTRKTLPQLLAEGWVPVREVPMGSNRDEAFTLVLLEKDE